MPQKTSLKKDHHLDILASGVLMTLVCYFAAVYATNILSFGGIHTAPTIRLDWIHIAFPLWTVCWHGIAYFSAHQKKSSFPGIAIMIAALPIVVAVFLSSPFAVGLISSK